MVRSSMWHSGQMSTEAGTAEAKSDGGEPLSFGCPRCESETTQAFYGPCEKCRAELRDAYQGEAREVEQEAYEPKMNVTPNAVALKE